MAGQLTLVFLTVCFLGSALSQVHLGPIGDAHTVECYRCEGHDQVPECLKNPHPCHHDEVCAIYYGPRVQTEIWCQKAHECQHDTNHPLRDCTGGGVEVHPNECQKCCTDSKCVSDLTDLLKIEAATSPDLRCPGQCTDNHLEDCIDHTRRCNDGQFCQVTKDDHGKTKGECKPDHELHHCQEEKNRHPCPGGHRCFWDCCTTNDCLVPHFGDSFNTTTTMAPAVTTMAPAMTTMAPGVTSGPGSLWVDVNGDCADQLSAEKCQELMMTQDVCHDRLALSVCPKTCGLCSAVNSTVCKDTVLNNGCEALKNKEDVCSDKLAVFICPQTCNMCDELINSVITGLVDGTSNSTDVPPSLLPPSANPSDFPTFNCEDLNNFDCGILGSLCGSSFINVVCPQHCAKCAAPVQTVPTSAPAMTTTDGAPAMTSTDGAPDTTVVMATVTAAPPQATTGAPAPMTTADSNMTTADSNCMDHLTGGKDCSQLTGVCGSVVALSVCPKYCGLC